MRDSSQEPVRIDVEAAQLDLVDAVLLDEGDERRKLGWRVADSGEGQEIDRDLPAGVGHQLRALGDLLQPVTHRPVVGAEPLIVETEDADPDRIQSGIDQSAEYVGT